MSKNKKLVNTKFSAIATFLLMATMVVTCRNTQKQNAIERIDNKIADLDKKITESKDIRTAPVPSHLHETQKRYNRAIDSVQTNIDSTESYYAYNDSLMRNAFNNFAVRIGRDFQLSKFLSQNDISIFQRHVAALDSMDFIHENARQRILNNNGSLNDLSYFLEIIDYDSVNLVLDNKLGWNFGTDTTGETDTVMIVPVLNFDTAYNNGATINNAMQTEQNLLNTAFMQTDTNAADSGARKFIVPEINSVYKNPVFAHNDSMLREHNNITQRAIQTEDSLLQYEQSLKFKRDSLLNERRKLEK